MGVYTSSARVAQLLQIADFTSSTTPTSATVEDFIARAEDEVDRRSGHAWRTTSVTNEYHTMYPTEYRFFWMHPRIRLEHFDVKTFATPDKLEIYDSATGVDGYANWITTKTENRKNGDFWVDYQNGDIYFIRAFPIWRWYKGVRVSYRYGAAVVPGWVVDVTTRMAALDVIQNMKQYAYTTPEIAKVDWGSVASQWRERIDATLDEQAWILRRKRPRLI